MKQNMHSEAIGSFDSAIKADKSSFTPYFNKALSFIQVHDYNSALQCMDTASLQFPDPPLELQKIRTYSIFKSGKVSSAISNADAKEPPTPQKFQLRSYSPIQLQQNERPKFEPRRMTMPVNYTKEIKGSLFPKKDYLNFTQVEEIDTRNIKTAFSVPITKAHDIIPNSMSPIRSSKKKQSAMANYTWKKYQPDEFFKPKQSLPLPISQMEIKETKTKDPIHSKKIRERLNVIEDKLIEYVAKKMHKGYHKPDNMNSSQLTEKEVLHLIKLFENLEQNVDELDKILECTDFFSTFSEEIRKKIYAFSAINYFEKGNRIFTQGNLAEKYYLLIKGKIHSVVDAEKAEPNSTADFLRYSRTISTDRKLVVIEEYGANCIAVENSYLLAISTREYQILSAELLKKEIEERVCFMINLPLFKGLDSVLLIPLAWHIKKEKYYEGQTILKKNDVPKGLVIIYTGYCGIYTTGYIKRSRIGSEYANIKIRKPKPPSFYTGNLASKPLKPAIPTKITEISETPSQNSEESNANNPFYKTYEKIEHGLLQYGDYFGGRVILDQKHSDLSSKFSIIAESKIVEILIFTKASLQFLQEKVTTHLKVVLQKSQDSDCPQDIDSQEMDQNFNKWQKYKNNIIDNIQRNHFVTSKRIQFPYLR